MELANASNGSENEESAELKTDTNNGDQVEDEKEPETIGTVHETNKSAILAITKLYGQIDADVTFSKGKFWKGVGYEPSHRFDIAPPEGVKNVVKADVRSLPVENGAFQNVMFDPPFIVAHGQKSIIGNRFSSYPNMKALWRFYDEALTELYRVTSNILVFKCQNTVSGGRQWFSQMHIANTAIEMGWYLRDEFVLVAKSRMRTHNTTVQKHARKFHSYFLVLEKGKRPNAM